MKRTLVPFPWTDGHHTRPQLEFRSRSRHSSHVGCRDRAGRKDGAMPSTFSVSARWSIEQPPARRGITESRGGALIAIRAGRLTPSTRLPATALPSQRQSNVRREKACDGHLREPGLRSFISFRQAITCGKRRGEACFELAPTLRQRDHGHRIAPSEPVPHGQRPVD